MSCAPSLGDPFIGRFGLWRQWGKACRVSSLTTDFKASLQGRVGRVTKGENCEVRDGLEAGKRTEMSDGRSRTGSRF